MRILLLLICISFASFASDEKKINILAQNFLTSIITKDKDLYIQSVSKTYLKDQQSLGFIKKTFTGKKKIKEPIKFDIKIKKGVAQENYYFINLKEKSKKSYGDNWFIVQHDKDKAFKITGMHHFED